MKPENHAIHGGRLRSLVLLIGLLGVMFSSAWTPEEKPSFLLVKFLYTGVFTMAGYLLGARRYWFVAYLALAIPFAAMGVFGNFHGSDTSLDLVIGFLLFGLHALFILLVFRYSLLQVGTSQPDRVIAGICGYLILGFMGANIYAMHEILAPGGFIDSSGAPVDGSGGEYLYFSLITLSTTGYGDILAKSPTARLLASTEAIVGTLYLAVFISAIISGAGGQQRRR